MIVMNKDELFINMLKAALNGQSLEISDPVDIKYLWKTARLHSVRATIAPLILDSGIELDEDWKSNWKEAKYKNIRKTLLFDVERKNIYRMLDNCRIAYAPLKGIIINKLYPIYGIREFSDNDIFVSDADPDMLIKEMESLGYEFEASSVSADYTFHKPPMFNFELHHRFFSNEKKYDLFNSYFGNIRERLIADGSSPYALSLSSEDSYVYLVAHSYKHYAKSGLGVRSLADIYLYNKKIPYDKERTKAVFEQIGITDFADMLEQLSQKVFGEEKPFALSSLSDEQRLLLEEMLRSGTFGKPDEFYYRQFLEISDKNGKTSKLRYWKKRLFPDIEPYRKQYPVFYKHKALHPLFYIYRPIRSAFVNGKAMRREIKTVSRIKPEKTK